MERCSFICNTRTTQVQFVASAGDSPQETRILSALSDSLSLLCIYSLVTFSTRSAFRADGEHTSSPFRFVTDVNVE